MHYQTEDAFAKAWKAGTRHGAYLFYGSENYLIQQWTDQVSREAGGDTFNLHRFDGKRPDLEALYEAVEALPLMAARKCCLVDDLDWKGMPAPEQEKLSEILSDLPEDCLLVATTRAGSFDARLAGSKKLIKLFDQAGCAVQLGSRDAGGKVAFLKSEAKKQGCSLSTDVAKYILQICEEDMLSLRGEVHKLCAFTQGGELTRAQVDAVCIPRTEARVFDLSKAILAGNTGKAMELLDTLFYLRESPVMILSVLGRSFVDLYRARVARDEGKTVAEVTALFGYKGREFVVRNAFSSAAALPVNTLRRSLDLLCACDRKLKSSPADGRILLEQTVIQLFVLTQKHR